MSRADICMSPHTGNLYKLIHRFAYHFISHYSSILESLSIKSSKIFLTVGSVSYTHLDVYKRQTLDRMATKDPEHVNTFLSLAGICYMPVSYTHLDVYKRQTHS